MPTTSPGSITRLIFERTFFERSKEKLTFLNSILPSILSSSLPLPKSCSGSASRISSIFSAERKNTPDECGHRNELENKIRSIELIDEIVLPVGRTILQLYKPTAGVNGINGELVKLLGKLKYRTSYGQNVLNHSLEVSYIAGLMASELGVDVKTAKRAGLLHDIGKALDHEMEGTHIALGVEFAKKYKEKDEVIHAIEAHHGDVEAKTLIAVLVQAADAISAARPGARRENIQNYIKRLEQLEEISTSFEGVEKSFAIQAGREVRIMVKPEMVSDDQMVILARDISKKIEEELEYPGQIKVHIIRESRVFGYAK